MAIVFKNSIDMEEDAGIRPSYGMRVYIPWSETNKEPEKVVDSFNEKLSELSALVGISFFEDYESEDGFKHPAYVEIEIAGQDASQVKDAIEEWSSDEGWSYYHN